MYSATNLILKTDSYKVSHYRQYPPKSERVYSYFESRGGDYSHTMFFGLQALVKKWLVEGIHYTDILEAARFFDAHLGPGVFNKDGWLKLYWKHRGRLPIRIKAVPEGTIVPVGNVLMTVENTDDEFPWLTNYLETLLSRVWYPSTVATQSRYMKQTILAALQHSGDPNGLLFKLHDFGFRGVSSVESAGLGGAAHLVNFRGTDTTEGLIVAANYYGEEMAGNSIPATEHSTITSWGRDHELDAYRNLLEQYPTGTIACVSDSYDIYNACANLWGSELRSKVLSRDGCLVVRPDSGDPCEVLPDVLEILGNKFGYKVNDKGFKVLNPKVRVIQGDGIGPHTIAPILNTLLNDGWSADNIAFGSGGRLLQQMDRDTCRYAFKCSAIKIDGKWEDVYKQPVTDPGKQSKRGRLALQRGEQDYETVAESATNVDLLELVFEDGQLVRDQSFADIRERANYGMIEYTKADHTRC